MTRPALQPIYVRMTDVQAVFGLSRDTLENHAKKGAITIYKRGAASLVKTAEIEAWIEGRQE